jgi:hypothetical protein
VLTLDELKQLAKITEKYLHPRSLIHLCIKHAYASVSGIGGIY